MELKKSQKIPKKYYCEKCDYYTCNSKDFNKHLNTRKHNKELIGIKKNPQNIFECCVCNKIYSTQSGLWKHQNKNSCVFQEKYNKEYDELDYKEMFFELKDMIKDILPKIQQPINNTTNNTTNNIFNINMFLNEQCKDAMNISEFIESIQLSLEDMARICKDGQTKGISTILIDKLNKLDILKRPVHCSDIISETIYVKDSDIWKQEDDDNTKLKHAIDVISQKSVECLPVVQNSKVDYAQTVSEILKYPREEKKIITSLARELHIGNQ